MRIVVFALLAIAIAGCAAPVKKVVAREAVLDIAEYEAFDLRDGSGAIEGQALVRLRNGGSQVGAGCEVYLNPKTTYSTEWYEKRVLRNFNLAPPDPKTPRPRVAIGDSEGRFRFDGVKPGDYYLTCDIRWEYVESVYLGPTLGWSNRTMTSGGLAHGTATVIDGETTHVVLKP